jgi:hypothetical protein
VFFSFYRRIGVDERTEAIGMRCTKRLKSKAEVFARKEKLVLAALVEIALATYIGQPKLANVPRKPMGRPKKEATPKKRLLGRDSLS